MAPAPVPSLDVLALEVTQTIQDLGHRVKLIQGKRTIVRAYVVPAAPVARPVAVSAQLAWRASPGAVFASLPSLNTIILQPGPIVSLETLRDDAARSINFELPPAAVAASSLELRLDGVTIQGGGGATLDANAGLTVQLRPGVPLRIHVIGLRYRDQFGGIHQPDPIDFLFIRSWLGRAYPVPAVDWSQIIVDANFAPPFVQPSGENGGTTEVANSQIAGLRAADMASGSHPRTHYYGLISDGNSAYFLRGLAFSIPDQPDPTVVASGPAGPADGFFDDHDRSYADWYCGHELGHTFGRYHPGFPPPNVDGGQTSDDAAFPYPDGRISGQDPRFVGFDAGDPNLNLPMRAMPGDDCHDVMTYMPLQWLSQYTYEAVYDRLLEEARLFGS